MTMFSIDDTKVLILCILFLTPVAVMLVDIIRLFLQDQPDFPVPETPRLQIWLQDMFVLSGIFVWAMMTQFDATDLRSLLVPVIATAFGFAISVDAVSTFERLSAVYRALVFVCIMTLSIECLWLVSMLWFMWNRMRARRGGRVYVSLMARNFAALAVVVYAVAFMLPVETKFGPFGFCAYALCFLAWLFHSHSDVAPMAAWMANPCFWIAIAFLLEGRRIAATCAGLIALGFALSINGSSEFTIHNSPGYAVWTFSMFLIAIFALILEYKAYRAKHSRANL